MIEITVQNKKKGYKWLNIDKNKVGFDLCVSSFQSYRKDSGTAPSTHSEILFITSIFHLFTTDNISIGITDIVKG